MWNEDRRLRLCLDSRKLNIFLVLNSGGLGDAATIFPTRNGTRYLPQIDLASSFHQLPIARADRHKTASRHSKGGLFDFTRTGFGLTVLPVAFNRVVKQTLGKPPTDVVS